MAVNQWRTINLSTEWWEISNLICLIISILNAINAKEDIWKKWKMKLDKLILLVTIKKNHISGMIVLL